MGLTRQQHEAALETLRDLFENDLTRLSLSVLIILSLVPVGWVEEFSVVFFGVFAVELALRMFILRHDLKHRSLNRVEVLFFFLDVLATLSFLPMESWWGEDIRYLRLFRLSRMVLLLGIWGPVMREVWFILMKRERRYQIVFVLVSALILSFISAILLHHFQTHGIDFNDDGNPNNDGSSFWMMLWWSFRQIQDPGNMLKSADASLAFFFSMALTTAGMFIFSFLIGIGASVVEELVKLGKERRLGVRRHTVICNLGPHSMVLLEELVAYYAKSFRAPRIVTLGPEEARFSYMLAGPLQRIRYRQGHASSAHDLMKVDADRATRVILLGQTDDRENSDSEVVSQVLSVREVNPDCEIYAELYRPDNVRAALEAGGNRTAPILADRMVGLFMANIVLFPGIQELYWELLTSRGDEIYTCLYERGAMAGRGAPSGPMLPFSELLARGHAAHGVIPMGYLLRDEAEAQGFSHVLNPGTPRGPGEEPAPAVPPVDRLVGFFGVADHFERAKGFVDSMPDVSSARAATERRDNGLVVHLCPAAMNLKNILICGFHSGIIDLCEQLALFCPGVRVFIMVPLKEQIADVVHAFLHRVDSDDESGEPRRVHFAKGAAFNRIRYAVDRAPLDRKAPGSGGQFHVVSGDWSDEQVLLSRPKLGYELRQMDAVLLTYSEAAADPDARTALGLLKLIRLRETRPGALKEGMRIVCEVNSSEKADLFRRRFGRPDTGGDSCHPVTIVPAKRLRNSLVAQSIFVPGIASIFGDLLSESGQEICKLLVDRGDGDPEEAWTFSELLVSLYHSHGLILLAVELCDPAGGNRRVAVNPRPREDDHRFTAAQLRSIFVVGDTADMLRRDAHCDHCKLVDAPAGGNAENAESAERAEGDRGNAERAETAECAEGNRGERRERRAHGGEGERRERKERKGATMIPHSPTPPLNPSPPHPLTRATTARRPLLLCALLLLPIPACRCPETAPSECKLEATAHTLPAPLGTPRLLSVARQGDTTAATWIDGEGARANVTVAYLDDRGRLRGKTAHLGTGGPPLMAAVATHQGKVAVAWMAGTPKRANIYGSLIHAGKRTRTEVADIGSRTDPGLAFVGGEPWVTWASGKAIWARKMGQGAPAAVRLVAPEQDAFWPLMISLDHKVALTYITVRSGFDLRLVRAARVADLARSITWRVPQKLHLRQVEPAMASDGADTVLAWSQILPTAEPGKFTDPHIQMARLGAGGKLIYYESTLKGLGPAVAPAAGGAVAVAWVRPVTATTARVRYGLVSGTTGGESLAVHVGVADPANGRPAMVRVPGGHLLLWIRAAAKPALREVRAVKVKCAF